MDLLIYLLSYSRMFRLWFMSNGVYGRLVWHGNAGGSCVWLTGVVSAMTRPETVDCAWPQGHVSRALQLKPLNRHTNWLTYRQILCERHRGGLVRLLEPKATYAVVRLRFKPEIK